MTRTLWIATAALSCLAGTADAQQPEKLPPADSFAELERRSMVGETVYILDAWEDETTGRVAALSNITLIVTVDSARRSFTEGDVRRIDRRRRDSARNGLLMGAGIGALMGFGIGRSLDAPGCSRSGLECGQGAVIGTVGGAFWGGLAGWIADALVPSRETVFSR